MPLVPEGGTGVACAALDSVLKDFEEQGKGICSFLSANLSDTLWLLSFTQPLRAIDSRWFFLYSSQQWGIFFYSTPPWRGDIPPAHIAVYVPCDAVPIR